MAPQAPRAVRAPVTFKKQKDHHSGLCDLQSPISNLQRRHILGWIQSDLQSLSPISNLQRHILPDPVRSPISISNLQSPISTCGGGVSGGGSTSFQGDALLLSHLQADLHPLFAPFCNLQSATRFSRRLWREVNISVSGLRSRGADGGSSRSLSSVKDL